MMNDGDVFVSRSDNSAASLASANYARTGRKTSPYLAHPERETYTEIETWRRPDGTEYRRRRTVSRWGASWSLGNWEMIG